MYTVIDIDGGKKMNTAYNLDKWLINKLAVFYLNFLINVGYRPRTKRIRDREKTYLLCASYLTRGLM